MCKYSVVLPCYNEADNLLNIIEKFRVFVKAWDFELILVDNGSSDGTYNVLSEIKEQKFNNFIKVVHINQNKGYGYGIQKGLESASGEILAYTHADDQTDPQDVFRAFDFINKQGLNHRRILIKGRRLGRSKKLLTTKWLSFLANFVLGMDYDDINGQPKVFGRSFLEHLDLEVNNFSYDLFILFCAHRSSFEVYDINVNFNKRLHGESKSAGNILKLFKTVLGFVYQILRFRLKLN